MLLISSRSGLGLWFLFLLYLCIVFQISDVSDSLESLFSVNSLNCSNLISFNLFLEKFSYDLSWVRVSSDGLFF